MSENPQPQNATQKLMGVILLPAILAGIAIAGIAAFNILKPQPYAGEMFGKKVRQAEFDQTNRYNRLQNMIRYGKAFESIEPIIDLDQEAWDQILLVKEAKNRKIKVDDQDVIKEVSKYPYFFRDGKFDSLLYRDIIRNSLKAEPKEFEESIRQSLLVEHLRDAVTSVVQPTDTELLAEFQKRRDLIQLLYVVVDDKPFIDAVTPSEEDLTTYFASHINDFEIDESVKIEYIWMPFPPDGGVQKQVETKFKGRAIIDQFNKNKVPLKDAAAGMKFELKESAFFTRENPPKDIGIDWNMDMVKTIFRMKKGELSQPLEQKTGYAIIRMTDKQPVHTPTLAEVKDQVTEKVKAEKAKDIAVQKASELIPQITAKIQTGVDFKTAATELGLEIKDSKLTQRESVISNLDIQESSVADLSKMTLDAIGPVLRAENGALIASLIKSVPVSENAFQKGAEAFRKLIVQERKDKLFETFQKDLRKKANIKKY